MNLMLEKTCHASAVSRSHLTAEDLLQSLASPCKICGGKSGIGAVSSPRTSSFAYQYHSSSVTYLRSSSYYSYHKVKWAKSGKLQKKNTNFFAYRRALKTK